MVPRHALDHGGAARRAADASRASGSSTPAAAPVASCAGRSSVAPSRQPPASTSGRQRSSSPRSDCRGSICAPRRSGRSPSPIARSTSSSRTMCCSTSTSKSLKRAWASCGECWRPGGTLLLRTNGARRLRRERDDWRVYDRRALAAQLERAGFACERVTYANTLLSLYGALRGRSPHAPSESHDGIPRAEFSRLAGTVGSRLLAAESRWLARTGSRLPYGHTLFAVATPA